MNSTGGGGGGHHGGGGGGGHGGGHHGGGHGGGFPRGWGPGWGPGGWVDREVVVLDEGADCRPGDIHPNGWVCDPAGRWHPVGPAGGLQIGAANVTSPKIQGNTLFLGDSITRGLPPFVGVDGQKSILALGGKTADWLLGAFRALEKTGALDGPDRPRNVVVLIGTNDIGGARTADQIFNDTSAVWALAHAHGARVVAMTLPPIKGYAGFTGRYPEIQAKRIAYNDLIQKSAIPDLVIPLDVLTADLADPEKIASRYDAGDHLHLQKPALGTLIQSVAAGALPKIPELSSPSSPGAGPVSPAPSGGGLLPYLMLGSLVFAGAVVLTRKRH